LPYRRCIDSLLLRGGSTDEVVNYLRLGQFPMPDDIVAQIEACRSDLRQSSTQMEAFFKGKFPLTDTLKEELLLETALVDGDEKALCRIYPIVFHPPSRQLVEVLALKQALMEGHLPGSLPRPAMVNIVRTLEKTTELVVEVEDILRYLRLFADTEENSWFDWMRFFQQLPANRCGIYRQIPGLSLDDLWALLTSKGAVRVELGLWHVLEGRLGQAGMEDVPIGETHRMVHAFRTLLQTSDTAHRLEQDPTHLLAQQRERLKDGMKRSRRHTDKEIIEHLTSWGRPEKQ